MLSVSKLNMVWVENRRCKFATRRIIHNLNRSIPDPTISNIGFEVYLGSASDRSYVVYHLYTNTRRYWSVDGQLLGSIIKVSESTRQLITTAISIYVSELDI